MRRVHASIKVGRQKKKKKERKSIQGGGALQGAGLRPRGECPQDRKAPTQRSRSFTNLPGGKGTGMELEQDPRRGGDALRLSGTLTEHLYPRESAPQPAAELPKGLQRRAPPRGARSSREAAGAADPRGGGCPTQVTGTKTDT